MRTSFMCPPAGVAGTLPPHDAAPTCVDAGRLRSGLAHSALGPPGPLEGNVRCRRGLSGRRRWHRPCEPSPARAGREKRRAREAPGERSAGGRTRAEEPMHGLGQDIRYAARTLRARKGFTIVAGLTLALGVGANTAIFSAVNALLFRPLPVPDVDRLVSGSALREGFDLFGTSLLEYALYRDEARSLAESGVGTPRIFTLQGGEEPERLRGAAVTASYLLALGVQPVRGWVFTDADDRPNGPAVALVGYDVWQRRFGGDPDVVGRVLAFEDCSCTVVGVLPRGFDLLYAA